MRKARAIVTFISLCGAMIARTHGDELRNDLPREWRVVVEGTQIFEKRKHLKIELDHQGQVRETNWVKERGDESTRTTVDPSQAVKGLHLVWSVLEDASLFSDHVEDGDTVKVSLQTRYWTWKRTWSTDKWLRGADVRLPLLVNLIKGNVVDETKFRMTHGRAAGIHDRWKNEWDLRGRSRPSYFMDGSGGLIIGAEEFSFVTRKTGWRFWHDRTSLPVGPKIFDVDTVPPPKVSHEEFVGILSELRQLCEERTAEGNLEFAISFTSGGTTTIQVRGLKSYADAGPLSAVFFPQVRAVLPQDKTPPEPSPD